MTGDVEFTIETLRIELEQLEERCEILEGFLMSALACITTDEQRTLIRSIAVRVFRNHADAGDGRIAAQVFRLIEEFDASGPGLQ